MKRKVGIVTLTKNVNFGNILQNIAMQRIINGLGYEAETIINLTNSTLFNKKRICTKELIKWLINYNDYRITEKQIKIFKKCCRDTISYSPVTYNGGRFSEKISEYDYFISGSDQVWNPTFGFATEFELLAFAPSNRRISYAASFGVDNLDMLSPERRSSIGRYLADFSYLSIREDSGKKIADSFPGVHSDVHVDPTMLLDGQQWKKLARNPSFQIPGKFILLYMLGSITHEYQKKINELGKLKKACIINVSEGKCRFIDPLQFIWLIEKAECVCTDSFHASVFSILFHTRFYIFNRKDSHADQSSRFTSLLRLSGIPDERVLCGEKLSYDEINWAKVDKMLSEERKRSLNYLKTALSSDNSPLKSIEILEKKNCCGCASCEQTCPKKAISMVPDIGGHLYPVVCKSECVDCGMCQKACPIINTRHREEKVLAAYAAYATNEEIRMHSSSGGLFSVLAQYVLDQNGLVFGAAMDDDQRVHHIGIDKKEDLVKLRGSKYVQSNIEDSYIKVKEALKIGKQVLFTGTACQISGLKVFLRTENINLLTVDVLCHGVPSPRLWGRYIDNRAERYGADAVQAFFRQKYFGWKTFAIELRFSNSTAYIKKFSEDPFMRFFLSNICLRDSCYDCKFKTLERDSDLTIGDAWGIGDIYPEMDNDKGTSVILVHTEKGKEILEHVSDELVMKKGKVDVLLPASSDSRKSVSPHPNRAEFFRKLDAGESCEKMLGLLCVNNTLMKKIKSIVKKIFKKLY